LRPFQNVSFFKFKEGENFNHLDTLSILRNNSPKFHGGLKFAPDAEIGQKEVFCEGLKLQYGRKAGDFLLKLSEPWSDTGFLCFINLNRI